MSTQTQNAQILKHLRAGKPLTPIEAFNRYKCMRLASRIQDLEEDGHRIKSRMVKLASGKRVASYQLSRR
jgi:hypothetical protein